MKRLLLSGLLSLGMLSSAQAETIAVINGNVVEVGDTLSLANGVGDNPGGEFNVDVLNGDSSGNPYWSGFCVEYKENFSYNETMTIEGISTAADLGGDASHGGSPDPISDATAWLFAQFWDGSLFGLNSGGTAADGDYLDSHPTNATYLQEAIWMLEEEFLVGDSNYNASNFYFTEALSAVSAPSFDSSTVNGMDGVRVLNLRRANGSRGQDQLVVIENPGGSPEVPEPSSFACLIGIVSVSLLGCGWRRKRQQAA